MEEQTFKTVGKWFLAGLTVLEAPEAANKWATRYCNWLGEQECVADAIEQQRKERGEPPFEPRLDLTNAMTTTTEDPNNWHSYSMAEGSSAMAAYLPPASTHDFAPWNLYGDNQSELQKEEWDKTLAAAIAAINEHLQQQNKKDELLPDYLL
jgi:hypothetical protein